jgi:hypothetical protein
VKPGPGSSKRASKAPAPAAPRRAADEAGRLIPGGRELLDPRLPWLIPILLLVVTRGLLARWIPYAAEDAYITFRYARNFAAGQGLVFNPGEPVFGFSSPLWTLWCAVGHLLTRSLVPWTRVTTVGLEIVMLLVAGVLLRRHASTAAAWCFAFFYAVWPYFAATSLSGMENTAMLALVVMAAALAGRASALAGPTLGALALVRPEGFVAAAILALGARWRDRLIALGIALIGLVALTLYFGSPVPQSVTAKSQLYGTPGPWAGRYWWDWLLPVALGRPPTLIEGVHLFLLSVVMAPAVVAGVRVLWPARNTPLALAILAGLVVWAGYALLGVAYFWWYLVVPLGAVAMLAAVGFPHIVRGPGLYVSAALFVAGLWTLAPHLYIGRSQNEFYAFAQVGNLLAAQATPGQKALLEPIGMIGYRAPLVLIDEVGLVAPAVARRRLQGPGWYADVVASERPDWLVVRRAFLRGGQAFAGAGAPFRSESELAAVMSRYEQLAVVDSTSGDQALVVLRRAP